MRFCTNVLRVFDENMRLRQLLLLEDRPFIVDTFQHDGRVVVVPAGGPRDQLHAGMEAIVGEESPIDPRVDLVVADLLRENMVRKVPLDGVRPRSAAPRAWHSATSS